MEKIHLQDQIMENEQVTKFIKERTSLIFKYAFWFKFYSEVLIGADHEVTKELQKYHLPFSRKQLFAILLQNRMTPKNSHRVELIKQKNYNQLQNDEKATEWLRDQLRVHLTKIITNLYENQDKLKRSFELNQKSKKFIEADTEEKAVAQLFGVKIGGGELEIFLNALSGSPNPVPLAAFKL